MNNALDSRYFVNNNRMVKTPEGLDKARIAGKLAARVLHMITPYVVPGVTTNELDRICHDFIVNELQAIPANIGYHGYQKTTCTSVNHVICHGIPSDKALKKATSSTSTWRLSKTAGTATPAACITRANRVFWPAVW